MCYCKSKWQWSSSIVTKPLETVAYDRRVAVPRAEDEVAEGGRAAAAIRSELARARESLRRIEQALGDLYDDRGLGGPTRARPERYLRVLLAVYERGGQHGVDADGLAAIGREHGYDRRGLGGFFTGGRAPLRRLGERVLLTVEGERLLDSYLARRET